MILNMFKFCIIGWLALLFIASPVASYAADDSGCTYFSPAFVLCSVHSHNVGYTDGGKPDNPEKSEQIADMNEVIALKSTVIAQQLKKQYDALNSVIKRFKTQLEKAVLTSKMELITGNSSSASGSSGSASSTGNTGLANAEDCGMVSNSEIYDCVRRNLVKVSQASDKDRANARKQLLADIKLMDVYEMCEDKDACQQNTDCKNIEYGSAKDVKACAERMVQYANKAKNTYEDNQRSGYYRR